MRKIAEIRRDLNAKVEEAKAIDQKTNAEAMTRCLDEIRALTEELNAANAIEATERQLAESAFAGKEKKEGRKFSFIKFIREISNGQGLTGIEAEAAEYGRQECTRLGLSAQGHVIPSFLMRASTGQNAGTALEGGNLGEQMRSRYVEMLKEKLVVSQLGATVLTDLVGTLPVITSSQITANWAGEGASAAVSKANYAKATMTPHRNTVKMAVSKDLLRQTSYDVEADLLDKMTSAHANLIEAAAIAGTGTSNQPKGILNTTGIGSVEIGTNGGAITWNKVVELESTINSKNANKGSLGYLTNSKVFGNLKTTLKAANSGRFIVEDVNPGVMNGYKVDWSNLVPADLTKGTASNKCSALIFGNWQDLYIGSWGGVDIVIDPLTKAGEAEILLYLNSWDDCLVAEPKSFAAIKDITVA